MFNEEDFEIVHMYTRANALEDGVLINLNAIDEIADLVQSHYKFPVDLTESVWAIVCAAVDDDEGCNDLAGVIHDLLFMSKACYEEINQSERIFKVLIHLNGELKEYRFKAVFGPDETWAPVVTIMLPLED